MQMQVIRGVRSQGFISQCLSLRDLGAVELWVSNPGAARPEGCLVVAAVAKATRRSLSSTIHAVGRGVWRLPAGSRVGRDPERCLCLEPCRRGRGTGHPAVAVGRWRLLELALRSTRSWLSTAALTPGAHPSVRTGTRNSQGWAASGCLLPASEPSKCSGRWGGALRGGCRLGRREVWVGGRQAVGVEADYPWRPPLLQQKAGCEER